MTVYGLMGLLAPICFLYAYAMVSMGRWQSTMLRFHVLNFLGGGFILLSMVEQYNLPVMILEICWCSISLYGIFKAGRGTSTQA